MRYASHLGAFVCLVGGPFPGFVGAEGSYPVDIRIDAPERHGRWSVLFRAFLGFPALVVASAYSGILFFVAVLGWFASLVSGHMPEGMRNIGAVSIRYQAQTWSYLFLVTSRYPYSCPALEDGRAPRSPEPVLLELRGRVPRSPPDRSSLAAPAAAHGSVARPGVAAARAPPCRICRYRTWTRSRTFGVATVTEAARYERFVDWNWVLSQVALLVVLAVYAKKGVAFVRQSAAGRIGTGMLLGMLGLALVWLSQLPFGLAGHWWDRRHDLTTQGYLSWAFSNWGELGAEFLSICLALLDRDGHRRQAAQLVVATRIARLRRRSASPSSSGSRTS